MLRVLPLLFLCMSANASPTTNISVSISTMAYESPSAAFSPSPLPSPFPKDLATRVPSLYESPSAVSSPIESASITPSMYESPYTYSPTISALPAHTPNRRMQGQNQSISQPPTLQLHLSAIIIPTVAVFIIIVALICYVNRLYTRRSLVLRHEVVQWKPQPTVTKQAVRR